MFKSMINAVSNIFILKIHLIMIRYEPQREYTCLRAFRRSDTNRTVKSQEMFET